MNIEQDDDRYCNNCGEEDDLEYYRTTASGEHFTCKVCGEDLTFQEIEAEIMLQ